MKGKRNDKYDNPDRHRKSKKKHKNHHESSTDSESSDEEKQLVETSTSYVNTSKKESNKKERAEASSSSSKIKKSKKKHKKEKKKHESSSDSESEEMQWVEVPSVSHTDTSKKEKRHSKGKHTSSSSSESSDQELKQKSHPDTDGKRDSWMKEESFVHTLSKDEMYTSSRHKRAEAIKEQQEKEKKIQSERELNPHWKNEGTGLPEKEITAGSLSLPSTSVGDGGYSWLKKAYYRIQEQAQQEGRSMEEIAVERWGSLSKLTSLIEEAEERMKNHPDFKHSNSQHKDKYDEDNRSRRMHFKKPRGSESEKNFDAPFQFRKPTDDFKNRKSVNQFKSTKKGTDINYMSEKSEYKNSEKSSASCEQNSENHTEKDIDVKKSGSGSGTPAWKKPKNSENKDDINYSEKSEYKDSDKSSASCKQNSKKRSVKDTEVKNSGSGSVTPAWKKPKNSENKDVPVNNGHSESHTPKTPLREVTDIENLSFAFSQDDLNRIAAKQFKAEMKKDFKLAARLQRLLDEARKIVRANGLLKKRPKRNYSGAEEIILTRYDSHGQARVIHRGRRNSDHMKKANKYFDDDRSYSLKQMFEQEKLTTANDQMEMFVEASAKGGEKAEMESESGHISKEVSKKLSSTHQEKRDIGKAIQEHQRLTTAVEKCHYCLDQPRMESNTYLIIDMGETAYLCVPDFQSMIEGHCLIVPKNHVSSLLLLDENEWREINDYKYQLRNMFRSEKKTVIFMETSMHLKYFPHAVLECIPVPEEEGDMAPFYFKKAIEESEAEWSHNKKLIDLKKKGLRRSVPKGLPYFYVEFDPKVHAGYAHVIEDEKQFPRNFGKEVVGGMLDIDYNNLYKNKGGEDFYKKCAEIDAFEKKWEPFKIVR